MSKKLTLLFPILTIISFVFIACEGQEKASLTLNSGSSPNKIVGGGCEGCEAIYEYGDKVLTNVDTLPDYNEQNPKMKITGTVFQNDGKTPAENVILYIYHTNSEGIYPTKGGEKGWDRRHGYIRGWIKTGKDGKYSFYTFRPGAYPERKWPEHIHATIKEPDKNEYYIDEFVFDDDPLLTASERSKALNRCGSGIMRLREVNSELLAERDIILGLNIPDYQ